MIWRLSRNGAVSLLSACLLAASFSGPAVAQTADAAVAQTGGASAQIGVLYDALRTAQTTGKTAQQRATMIAPAVDKTFDLQAILRRSVGVRYNTLSPADQTRLLGSFRQFTIARYASSFKPQAPAVFKILPGTRANPTGGQIVDTTIGGSDGSDTTPIDYVMSNGPTGWRITDILLNAHISQVAAQRADFGGALSQGGASGLANDLDTKTAHFLHD